MKGNKEMKKVGLCVRYDCDNYGSMLQILATEKAIERCGCDYEIIRYDKRTVTFMIKNISRLFNPYFIQGKVSGYKKLKLLKEHPEEYKRNQKRNKLFSDYRKKYIGPYSPIFKGYSKLVEGMNRYDIVMVGSDQLWTPAGIKSRFYNLLCVPDDIRKVSLATSFGVTSIPKNQEKLTSEYLNRIDYLSVREVSGQKLVKNLTNRDAFVALDPTLLFSDKEWEEIFPNRVVDSVKYIFAYLLGTNVDHRKQIEEFAKKKRLKIISCPCMDEFVDYDLHFSNEQRYEIDPIDFLNLIRNAEYVCTDSFHGTVFSILNHKKFATFNRYDDELRKSKNSRIGSLFYLLGLEERHCFGSKNVSNFMEQEIEYEDVENKLQKLREESFEFLREALK